MRELSKVEIEQVSGAGVWDDLGRNAGTVFRWFTDGLTSFLFDIFATASKVIAVNANKKS
ncbi:hypothetical protein [Xylella fastidiosa]|uniref:hypothetical protein n=1 Tax=Xylella fastidiosa TaxID=2371 RepID=UPI0003D2A4DD|nr:hypothetical protein [Xylella fastidiosa]ALQ97368.1 hypothetical protein XFC3_08320 [Xylella fastidiosa]ALR01740.1 hypothetical protein OY18_05255 [Xylella fastidiosa]ETE31352.1 hypothetical protein B398_08335 [Xylella fastidiosa 32]KXB13320.1 hypothetical protein ADT29_08390 [Xylella fastidiosa]MDG5822007.1 hypothetical protein [Xylella fastidiosa subsp. pauca]